jgi:hypothetical protein
MFVMILTANNDYLQNNIIRLSFVTETQLSLGCMTYIFNLLCLLKKREL